MFGVRLYKKEIFVKIDIKVLKTILTLGFLCVASTIFAHTVDKYTANVVENEQMAQKINGGVNVSWLQQTWDKPLDLLDRNIEPTLKHIKKLGFKNVRIPVALDMFCQPNSANLTQDIINKLGETYNVCDKLGLSMIISYHDGKIYYGSDNRWYERDRILWMWKQLQNKFRGMGYNDLFFELYNEPTAERIAWKEDCIFLVNGLRYEDKSRWYIVGGTNYNNADELLDLGKLDDDKILYTIHFYEPYIFTHQGAEWTKDKTYITGIPFPYNKKKMPGLTKEATGTQIEQDYTKYPAEGTEAYMLVRLRRIAEECKKRNMPLVCTESGVINLAEEKSRLEYFQSIINIFSTLDIPLVLWDYNQKFNVVCDNQKLYKPLKNCLNNL
jgi:endoglucanase